MIIILSIAAVAVTVAAITFALSWQSRYLESVTISSDPHEFEDA